MDNSPGPLFKPDYPHQPVAALMLVENSQAMSYFWPDLRDNHLKMLIDNIVLANPSVPITVSVLESYPSQTVGPNPSTSRQYSGSYDSLHGLTFNPNPGNIITAGRVENCIEILDSMKAQNQSTALHLIIVAVTPPSEDNSSAFPGNIYVPWISLAQKMGERNIHCHIVVSSQQEMSKLTLLFEETLQFQGNVEQSLYTPQDPSQWRFRLSVRPPHESHIDTRPTSLSVGRIMPPRRNSYPLDNFYPEVVQEPTSAAAPAEGDEAPRLVSQLQQVHGLTKKKVYGSKPPRQSFFKDERVQHKYRPPPAPLTMPMTLVDQVPSPTAGGRALSQSRADRLSRLSQASPTDTHPRRQPTWARRGSRFSTPEADNHSWPITPSGHINDHSPGSSSYVSSDMSSPVTPATTIEDVYAPSSCGPAMQPPVHRTSPDISQQHSGGGLEGNWQTYQISPYVGSYNPNIQTYFPPVGQQYHSEMVHNTGNFDMGPPTLVPATPQQGVPPSYRSPTPVTATQAVPHQTVSVPAGSEPQPQQPLMAPAYTSPAAVTIMQPQQHALPSSNYNHQLAAPNVQQPQHAMLSHSSQRASPPVVNAMQGVIEHAAPLQTSMSASEATHHASHPVPPPSQQGHHAPSDRSAPASRGHKKSGLEEDEERFTFGKQFVAATAVLFEEEVLPAYPSFPSRGSTLYTAGMARDLPSELPASEAGELYATRNKQSVQSTTGHYPGMASFPPAYTAPLPMAPPTNGTTATSMAMSSSYDTLHYNYALNTMNYNSSLTGWAGS